MREMHVSLLVTTTLLDLSELSKQLGCEPSPGSHDKGASRVGRQPFHQTIWRLDSSAPSSASLMKHCESISSRLPAEEFCRPGRLPQDAKIYLDIAIFFNDANCTVQFPIECMEFLRNYNAEMEVSCYPSERLE